ncbi:type II toxin-antitoxin system CcdA family antitoxin [Xenorhabdus sp. DI]|uniref:type II toxin-antitoxin system CcdA family antitoxin n=1 Tax=Xenorhabdus doucetiae TaxID=351671 RepID=UPI0019C9C3CF|nr:MULTISPECIES: type II toxin-antitoxin system CcdA family antitoxin [unclassified Xenorhabdus]MBD2784892.1 type II toxin-antitoxin system CcdA family antitoxin [Xenorhabdus sp. 3]MBD2787483.1 type II toxin-antitoxin system CcdA family antitoxin [Xenorhabdus sp. DI]
MRTSTTSRHGIKKSTNVYLTAALVETARSMNINLSATLDKLLAQEIEARKNEQMQEKQDMQTMNAFIERAGMLTDDDFFGSL